MSYTKEKIFNIVLNNLGITAVVQNTVEVNPINTVLNNFYEMALEQIMKASDWNFLKHIQTLTPSINSSPNPKYRYCYDYPNDCIAARYLIDDFGGNYHKFEVLTEEKGNKIIVCNIPKAKLQYTRRLTDNLPEAYFTSEFVVALSFYLAYLSAIPLTNNGQIQQVMFQSYQHYLANAKAMSANESEHKDEDDRDYTDYR